MPQVRPNRFTRWLGRTALRLGGWRVVGPIPDLAKAVLIVAPHSSNWDGIWGMAAKIALGLQVRVLGKAQLFWWPLGPLLRRLGAIPVNRSSPKGTVEQAVAIIEKFDRIWFTLTPEGTRKRVEHWKTGFWKIARAADVPIVMAYFHYPEKTIGIGQVFLTSDSLEHDMARIREWYRPWQGRNRDTV
ncbi:acyltransferase [Pseudoxanthomonas gei]|uniref:Acyltransferase n=1 Tax=Pseudoxanthomonas gei TaxID=1383030 RepID=A0ABX0ADS8_9GAMM|nr:lysophospholipid acyltransferase family protein [Pseudoxanthomonas gei]NDK39732.1 acyltransferase [Pseudoxanthomonas gei]